MSQSYFPAGADSNESERPTAYAVPTQRGHEYAPPFGPEPAGYPPDANRGNPPDGAPAYPSNTHHGYAGEANNGYAPHPNLGRPAYGMQPPQPPTPVPPTPVKQSLPRRAVATIGVLGLVTLGLAGYTVTTQSSLSKAQSSSEKLSGSLDKANAAVTKQKKELDGAKKDLEASAQAAAAATAGMETAKACALGLVDAWSRYFDGDEQGAMDVLSAAIEVCEPVLSEGSQQ